MSSLETIRIIRECAEQSMFNVPEGRVFNGNAFINSLDEKIKEIEGDKSLTNLAREHLSCPTDGSCESCQ